MLQGNDVNDMFAGEIQNERRSPLRGSSAQCMHCESPALWLRGAWLRSSDILYPDSVWFPWSAVNGS